MKILFLDLDTLRPDHLSCYGYHRKTSPNIDRIAREGVRFNNYYCSDAPCLPSRTALMTGKFGIHNGVVGHGGTTADIRTEGEKRGFRSKLSDESLSGFLSSLGFKTVSISPFAERHGAWFFNAGFSEVYNTGKRGQESAENVTPTALKWIKDHAKEDDWFLHINYWDPHTPYRSPRDFGNPFAETPLPSWYSEELIEKHKNLVGPHSPKDLSLYDYYKKWERQPNKLDDMNDLKKIIDGYDCGISYMDSHIGKLFDAFEKQGVMDELVIIITSDHGEQLGELGLYMDHVTADLATCKIPMIIRWPGGKKDYIDEGLHYNLDLAPTLAQLLKENPISGWDGQSYAPAILEGKDCGRKHLILSQCAHVAQRSVRFGSWHYIKTYHGGYHLFPKEMLFNIKEDPHEQNNLAESNKEICEKASYKLTNWHDKMMQSMPYVVDPLQIVLKEVPHHAKGHLPKNDLREYFNFLKNTGRADSIAELKKQYKEEI